jgi:hypothetical protein
MPLLGTIASQFSSKPFTSFESIASTTASGSTRIMTFSSIPSTYIALQVRINGFTSSADNWSIRFNGDSGTNYTTQYMGGINSFAFAGGYTAPFDDKGSINGLGTAGTGTVYPNVGIVDIHKYASTTENKTARSFFGADSNGTGAVCNASVLWLSTSAITSLSIITTNYDIASSTVVSLYGIAG